MSVSFRIAVAHYHRQSRSMKHFWIFVVRNPNSKQNDWSWQHRICMSRPLHSTWGICTRRAGKLYKARSRLYRSQIYYSLESSRRDLHNALLCTVLESNPKNHRSLISKFSLKNADFFFSARSVNEVGKTGFSTKFSQILPEFC